MWAFFGPSVGQLSSTYVGTYIFMDFLPVDPEAQCCVPSPGVTSSRNQLSKWLNLGCHSARTPLH